MRFRVAAAGVLAAGAMTAAGALAVPQAGHAQTTPISHVVVIYLENHSFDSLLGYWCDDNPGRCPDGGMPSSVTLSDGSVVTPGVSPQKVPGLPHNVASQVTDMNDGAMNGWQNQPACNAATGYKCISGYEPSQIPNITSLAGRFAISDDTFSMADSPSWGGHLYAVAATLDHFTGNIPYAPKGVTPGPGWGCDSNRIAQWVNPSGKAVTAPACIPDPALGLPNGGAFKATPVPHVPTIMDELDAAHLSWKIYGATLHEALAAPRAGGNDAGYGWSVCPSFAGCLDTPQDANLIPSGRFQDDALNGALPAFSLVTPGGASFPDSCHNDMSITACDNWVGSLVSSIENGPDWDSTAVFITWDDFGGFYDQVPPPASLNADGQQAGPRSPLIIVSPYARPGFTDTTPDTFAGILAYTEHNFGLAPLAANDAAAYDFNGAFDYTQTPLKPVKMTRRPLPRWAAHMKLTKAMLDDPT